MSTIGESPLIPSIKIVGKDKEPASVNLLPDDVLKLIFSWLDLHSQIWASRVNKKWHQLLEGHIADSVSLSCFSLPSKTLISAKQAELEIGNFDGLSFHNDNLFAFWDEVLINGKKPVVEPLFEGTLMIAEAPGTADTMENQKSAKVINQIPRLRKRRYYDNNFAKEGDYHFFLQDITESSPYLKGICGKTGKEIFNVSLACVLKNGIGKTEKGFHVVRDIAILSCEPLIFLTFLFDGSVIKLSGIENSLNDLSKVEEWNLFDAKSKESSVLMGADVYQDYVIVVANSSSQTYLHIYSLTKKEKIFSYALNNPGRHYLVKSLIFVYDGIDKIHCFKIEKDEVLHLWTRSEAEFSSKFLSCANEESCILANSSKISVLNSLTGEIQKTFDFKLKPNEEVLTTNLQGNLLILHIYLKAEKKFGPVVLLGLNSGQFCEYKGNRLLDVARKKNGFLLLDHNYVKVIEQQDFVKVAGPQIVEQKPSVSQPELDRGPQGIQKVALVAAALFFALSFGFFVYFSVHRSVNLSIGLGISTAGLGLTTGILAWKQRNNCFSV